MSDLLLREPPRLPPNADAPRAIQMLVDFPYSDIEPQVPVAYRGRIPEELKRDGVLWLYAGDRGFYYQSFPDLMWSMCVFYRKGYQIHSM